MLSQRFVSLLPTSTSFVLLQKRKRELAPGYIWMDEETGVFLSLMQGDKTTIGYFNWMKLKNKKIKKRCRGRGAIVGIEEIAGLRSARQQSPFFTMVIRDEWLVSFDYAIVIHSIHSMLKNSIHSIQKLMNGPTATTVVDGTGCAHGAHPHSLVFLLAFFPACSVSIALQVCIKKLKIFAFQNSIFPSINLLFRTGNFS